MYLTLAHKVHKTFFQFPKKDLRNLGNYHKIFLGEKVNLFSSIEIEKEVTEYYHKYVVCQLILCSVPVIIDIEPINPGEGELTAAKRLIKRILNQQPRRVDVFCFDALYLDSDLLNLIDGKKKFWVAVFKYA